MVVFSFTLAAAAVVAVALILTPRFSRVVRWLRVRQQVENLAAQIPTIERWANRGR